MTDALTQFDLNSIRDGLENAVEDACTVILRVLDQGRIQVQHKWGEGPVTEADHAADDVLQNRLLPLVDGSHWLSEESSQSAPLIPGKPTWVVDPLDGTHELLNGIPEFAVSVGFFVDDRLVLGAVALPIQRQIFSGLLSTTHREARCNKEPLSELPNESTVGRVVVSRFDYEHQIHRLIPYDVYPAGSSAVKLAHVASGEANVYLSTGPRSVWDVAGGAAVLKALGGTLLTYDNQDLHLSPQQVRIPAFAAGYPDACRMLLEEWVPRFNLGSV